MLLKSYLPNWNMRPLNWQCVKTVLIRSYLVRMWKNTDQINFEYGHFLRSVIATKKHAFLALFRMGRGRQKAPPPLSYQFFPCNFYKCRKALKTFWLSVLNLLPNWRKISRLYLVPVSNFWTGTKTNPQKEGFFWSNPCGIEVMIPSLIEFLELPKFGHMITLTI